jgi:hypothetical protein
MRARLSFVASLLLVLLVGVAAANAATGGSLTSGWSESSTVSTRTDVPPVRLPDVPPRPPARSADVSASTSCVNDVCTVCVDGSCTRTGVPEAVADAVVEAVPRELPRAVRDLTDCLED